MPAIALTAVKNIVSTADKTAVGATADDTSTVNYTGALISAPTGYTRFSSNEAITAVNGAEPAVGSFAADGWILGSNSTGAPLQLSGIGAGNWVFTGSYGGQGLLGPTVSIGVRVWQVSASLATRAVLPLTGANAAGWLYTGNLTAAATWTITSTASPAFSFSSSTPCLFIEIILRVVTGGSNITANPQTTSATSATIPALLYNLLVVEAVTAPADTPARGFIGGRSTGDSTPAPSDTATRLFTANRTIGDSTPAPLYTPARVVFFWRSIGENIAKPTDAHTRSLVLARTVAENVAKPTDSVARTVTFRRSISEVLP